MRIRSFLPTLVAIVVLGALGRADEWSKEFPVTGTPELRLTANDARVHLVRGSGKQIAVSVRTVDQRIGPGGVTISASQSGDTVLVQVHEPSIHVNIFSIHRSTQVEIAIPEHARVEVKTGDGNIDLDDISGAMRLHTGDGHIHGTRLDGSLQCNTSDGHVEVDGRFDELRIDTGDGHVIATATGGSKLGSGWNIHTGDGSVELRIPSDLAASLDAHTGDGHIESDLPIEINGRLERSSLRGNLHGGGPPLQIRTGDGSIRLRRGGSSL